MTSFIRKRLALVPFLAGFALGALVIIIANSLRPLDNSELVVLTQIVIILSLGLITGLLLRSRLKHPYFVSTSALFYTYAISIAATVLTDTIHYGLSALITAFIAIGLFYLSDMFFNRLKLRMAIKLLIATMGFIVIFAICATLGVYILRLIY